MEEQFHVSQYLRIIPKYKWMIILITAGCAILMVIFNEFTEPLYKASTQVIIQRNVPTTIVKERSSVRNPYWITKSDYITKIKTITAKPVMSPAAKKLFELGYFKEVLQNPGMLQLKNDDPESFYYRLAMRLTPMVKASNLKETDIVEIEVQNTDPNFAKDAANIIAETTVEYNRMLKIQEAEESVAFLKNSLEEAKDYFISAERKLYEFKTKEKIVSYKRKYETMAETTFGLSNSQIEIDLKIRELNSRLENIKELLVRGDFAKYPFSEDNSVLSDLNARLVNAEIKYQELNFKYGNNHPAAREALYDINVIKENLERELRNTQARMEFEVSILNDRKDEIDKQRARLEDEVLLETEIAADFFLMEKEAASAKEMYDILLDALKESSVNIGGAQKSFVYILTSASLPRKPIKPNKPLNLIFSVVVGLFISVGAAFFQEYMDQTIRTPEDVEKRLDLNVLAVLPAINLEADKSRDTSVLYVSSHPKSLFSEGIISLRANLAVLQPQEKCVVTIVTSSVPREGKSVIAANLALAFSQEGSQTLIIDCDLRRPVAHKIFKSENIHGLSHSLTQLYNMPLSEIDPHKLSFGDIQILLKLMKWSGTVGINFNGIKPSLQIRYDSGVSNDSNLRQWKELNDPQEVNRRLEDIHYTFEPFIREEASQSPDFNTAREIATTFPRMLKSKYFISRLLNDFIEPTEFNNLHVLTSGLRPTSPNELLSSEQMRITLQLLRSRFERIIIDAPPAFPLSDVSILSPYGDQTIWVVRSGEVNVNMFKAMMSQLKKVNANIMGVVINCLDLRKENYYAYGYKYKYGYRYKYKYGYGYQYKYSDSGYGYYPYYEHRPEDQKDQKPKLTLLGRLFNREPKKQLEDKNDSDEDSRSSAS